MIEEVFHRAMASILEELGFDPNFDSFAEMGMDSLDYVDFIVRIELRFEVRVPEGVVFEDLTELEQWMVER